MISVIWKERLDIGVNNVLMLPDGAEVLHVGHQERELCIWFLCDPSRSVTTRKFIIEGTGFLRNDNKLRKDRYLGTAVKDNGIVWHVFEDKD